MPPDFKQNVLDYYRVPGEITKLEKHSSLKK